jgi:hypothetical protein
MELAGRMQSDAERIQCKLIAAKITKVLKDDRSQSRTQRSRRSESRHAKTLERGASRSATDGRCDDQFENCDIREVNPIILDLGSCVRGTEIPLLAHNFSKRAPAVRRPSQDELLGVNPSPIRIKPMSNQTFVTIIDEFFTVP